MSRINVALSKAAAVAPLRKIDEAIPATWEFSGFSQNGEDGIIDFLIGKIKEPNRYFIEIGSSDGIENNTAWLAVAKKYCGIMVEGNSVVSENCRQMMTSLNFGVECISMFVSKNNINDLLEKSFYKNPDIFSLDIDGNDYYLAQIIMEAGFKPKIFVVEYNSVYGPKKPLTIEYKDDFVLSKAHASHLYYGVSVGGWKNFFKKHGYQFITVDQSGVNAFFVNPSEFGAEFLNNIKGVDFQENYCQLRRLRVPWGQQFERIKGMNFVEIK